MTKRVSLNEKELELINIAVNELIRLENFYTENSKVGKLGQEQYYELLDKLGILLKV